MGCEGSPPQPTVGANGVIAAVRQAEPRSLTSRTFSSPQSEVESTVRTAPQNTLTMSENTETAILAGGCFWPAQQLLRERDGVLSTRVGYTGGENVNPTAFDHPGHAEAVVVVFDPERTSYRNILEFFFQIHRADLDGAVVGSDYRSEIFYTTEEQRQVAEDTRADARASGIWPGEIVTKISPAGRFWEAEAEDQDYLKHYPNGKNQFSPQPRG
jgi:peptide-methionine (S)-S-oxide reductase